MRRDYSSNKYGVWRRVDIEAVMLGDRLANDLNQWQLAAELKRLKVPRVTDGMGKSEMIFLLGIHQQEVLEAKRAEATKA
jgi:hypothetical protein